ncbi:class I SAM-dependent methyltransferase [Shinella sedimenti]|uniref:Class I SAM-dependent methyltransferase n=1 Tax=Shinella sedimenti TaxID=2919913 RepID=A0ABT0CI62_9HYPH|nr:class I SAM-dependent methyltransferase [Shinella sedimenti]MCJ8148303.1 class I SAM-dependent methyltransferase [Shinella sedimenti]
MEDRLYHDPALADFYDLENGWDRSEDFTFCQALAAEADSVLDLGCGTGELAVALSGNRMVVGVDPAPAMLEIARAKPGAARVEFIEGDARTLRLGRRFALVMLTGHAFQVFLTQEDRRAALATIAAHLAPGGRFIFDSREPACREWEEWGPDESRRRLAHPRFGAVQAWNDAAFDDETGVVTYETHYEIEQTGQRLSAASRIAFPTREELERLIVEAGLRVERWYGDWQGTAWTPGARELIPLGTLA